MENLFERLWQLYPKKRGKESVSKKAKQKLLDAGYEKVAAAIQNYKKEREGKEEQYTMYGSTFFNGRWEDYVVESMAEETTRPASDYYQRYFSECRDSEN